MHASQRLQSLRRPWVVWAVLCVAWAFVLTSALPRVRSVVNGVEVCTVQGARWVALEATAQTEQSNDSDAAHASKHCPLCSVATDRWIALPPAGAVFFTPIDFLQALPLWCAALHLDPPFAWAAPRGPPLFFV